MESHENRAEAIIAVLGKQLAAKQESMTRLADTVAEFEAARIAFDDAYAVAIKSGWTPAELKSAGVSRDAKATPIRTKARASRRVVKEPVPVGEESPDSYTN